MNRVGDSRGFTIVETVIFLAVSSAMFISAMALMGGQQAKTEFRQAVGETQSRVDDVINDVATGYYSSSPSLECFNFLGTPGFRNTSGKDSGTNPPCIFVGRAVQLGVNNNTKANLYTIAGFRQISGVNTTSLESSQAKATIATETNHPELIEPFVLPAGMKIAKAFYQATPGDPAKVSVSGFAVASSLASYNIASGGLKAGASTVDIYPLPGSFNVSQNTFISGTNTTLRGASPVKNPAGGISVCIDSGGTNQHFILRIGVSGNLSTTVEIKNGLTASDPVGDGGGCN